MRDNSRVLSRFSPASVRLGVIPRGPLTGEGTTAFGNPSTLKFPRILALNRLRLSVAGDRLAAFVLGVVTLTEITRIDALPIK